MASCAWGAAFLMVVLSFSDAPVHLTRLGCIRPGHSSLCRYIIFSPRRSLTTALRTRRTSPRLSELPRAGTGWLQRAPSFRRDTVPTGRMYTGTWAGRPSSTSMGCTARPWRRSTSSAAAARRSALISVGRRQRIVIARRCCFDSRCARENVAPPRVDFVVGTGAAQRSHSAGRRTRGRRCPGPVRH